MIRIVLATLLLVFGPLAALAAQQGDFRPSHLIAAARAQVGVATIHDASYIALDFPGGDVPAERGVCSDVIVRALRAGWHVDLQLAVNRDMTADFAAYPAFWGLHRPDPNIDHRRVPNLSTFLTRIGAAVPLTSEPTPWLPGDIVTWSLPGNLNHIGIVSDRRTAAGTPLVLHDIGAGAREDDILFDFPVTGHFRLGGESAQRLHALGA